MLSGAGQESDRGNVSAAGDSVDMRDVRVYAGLGFGHWQGEEK